MVKNASENYSFFQKKKWKPPPVRKNPILYVNYSLMNVWWYHLNHEKKCFSHITNLHTDMHQSVQTVNMDNILSIISFEEDICCCFFILKFSIFLILSLNWRSWKGEKTYWHLKKYKSFFLLEYTNIIVWFTPPNKSSIYDTISLLKYFFKIEKLITVSVL